MLTVDVRPMGTLLKGALNWQKLFTLFIFSIFSQVLLAQQFVSYPDNVASSGRMVNIVRGFASLGDVPSDQQSLSLKITVNAASTDPLVIQLFDGDTGGKWDNKVGAVFDPVVYEVYADPTGGGLTDAINLITTVDANTLADNDWSTIHEQANDARALNADGTEFVYHLVGRWVNPVVANELNNFKVRTNARLILPIGVTQGLIGYTGVEFDFNTPFAGDTRNTFDGTYTFKTIVRSPESPTDITCSLDLYDGDLDLAADTDDSNSPDFPSIFSVASSTVAEAVNPGDPADDSGNPNDLLTVAPSIFMQVFYPNGMYQNLNVSGSQEWELLRILSNDPYCITNNLPADRDTVPGDLTLDSIEPGEYFFVVRGADGRNTIFFTPIFELEPAVLPSGSIGNYVWIDENGDGYQDIGETGLPNVTVELTDSVGTTFTQTTDHNGGYLFTGLFPDNYTVSIDETTLPAGMTQSTNPVFPGADLGNQSQPYAITLGLGEQNLTADFGYEYGDPNGNSGPGAIGDYVWIDTNGDGVQDNGEAGLGGVEVSIYYDSDGDGQVNPGTDDVFSGAIDQNGTAGVGSTTTEVDGSYVFTNLPNGIYKIVVNDATLPSGYIQTGDPDEFGSAATNADNQTTNAIVIAPGDAFLNADFGYQPDTAPSNSIGDFVYLDADSDGQQTALDVGLEGVTMSLVDTASGESIATTVTDSNGFYLFDGLPDGDYTVVVSDANGIVAQLNQTADPDAELDGMSSTSVAGGTSDLEQDFGYTSSPAGGTRGLIGDTVFFDINNNGVFDDGEGMQDVTVELYTADGATLLDITTTNSNGFYSFGGLVPNDAYTVRVLESTLPSRFLTNTVDPDGGNDSESFVDLSADPDGVNDGVNLDQDFGYASSNVGTIGNLVWLDTNADGFNNGPAGSDGIPGNEDDEPGLEGITLDLYVDTNNDGLLQPGEPKLASTTTDNTGAYLFTGLPGLNYIVDVSDRAGLLNGYWHTLGDRFVNDNSQADPYPVSLIDVEENLTADFGYQNQLAGVGDFVWFDSNADGIQQAGEPGIGQVNVTLEIVYPDSSVTIISTMTNSAGLYEFTNLLADEDYNGDSSDGSDEPVYTVTVDTPAGLAVSPIDQGGDDALDADNPAGEIAEPIPGTVDDSNDFGFYDLGSISGTVSEDTDRDGTLEGPLENVTVYLFADADQNGVADDVNGDGTVDTADALASDLTDAQGDYEFTDVSPGNYLVMEEDPAGYESILDNDDDVDVPSDATEIANTNPRDNVLPVSVIVDTALLMAEDDTGNNFVDSPQLAGLGDTVWYDHNSNGQQEAGEAGIANVTVNLLDGSGNVIDTMTTDDTGFYQFTDLLAGDYTVQVDPGSLPVAVEQTFDLDDGVSPTPATPNAASVSLSAGEANNDVDFGYRPLGSIGDTVWLDSNANGVQDAGEAGIEGVSVSLTGPVADTATTDSDGFYEFTDLPLGVYTVSVSGSAISDLEQTHDLDDPVTTTPSTADTADVELELTATGDAIESRDDVDFGYREKGTISGSVTEDTDADGAGDQPQVGVTVELYEDTDGDGQPDSLLDSTTTDANGDYQFTDLPAGDYVVVEITPDGLTDVSDEDTTADGDAFDADQTVDDQIAVTLTSGETDDGNDFVDENTGSISGNVTEDTTGDGLGDTPQQGVTVELYEVDGAGNPVGDPIATTVTASDGSYSFDNVSPGDYMVIEVQPAGLEDVSDSDETPEDSNDGSTPVDNQIPVTVQPGEADDDNNFVDVNQAGISGNVSEDTNADGAGDIPIQGVVLELFADSNGDGQPDGSAVQMTTTDSSGNYSFTDLMPGDYVVVQTQPGGLSSVSDQDASDDGDVFDSDVTVDEQIAVTLQSGESDSDNNFVEQNPGSISGSVLEDTDGDGTGDSGLVTTVELYSDTDGDGQPDTLIDSLTTNPDGSFNFTNVPPGNYVLVEIQPDGFEDVSDSDLTPEDANDGNTPVDNLIPVTVDPGEDDADNVFVEENSGSISGTVTQDTTGNGLGDTPLEGVTVELYADNDADGQPDGTAIATTTTATDGSYLFDNLSPGDYVVVEIQPVGLQDVSDQDESGDGDAFDGNTVVDNQVASTVEPGEADTDNNFVDVSMGGIAGTVTKDTTGDNLGDTPLATVMLELFADTNGDGQPDGLALALTTTDANGNYSFLGIMPGDYVVVQTQPDDLISILDEDQAPDGDAFDADTTVDNTIAASVVSGELDDANNFVEQELGSISGWVAIDTNGSGSGDTPLSGVTLTLLDSDDNIVATTTSATGGGYSFNGLNPGDYTVVETQPAGYTSVKDEDVDTTGFGDPDPQDSDTTVDDRIGVNLKPGESDISNNFVEELPQVCPTLINFDTDADGAALAAGTIIDDEFAGYGISVSTNDSTRPAMIFDSSNPTGGDVDLGTPNQDFGGPGVGAGGASGEIGENSVAEGNILIISEDGDQSDPDDNAAGGTLIFDFATPYKVASVTLIDIENTSETYEVRAYDAAGSLISTSTALGLGNNSREQVLVNADNVSRLEIQMSSSGGVANLDIVCPDEPAIDIRKQAEGHDVRTFAPGDTVDFEIAVTNTGAVDLNNVVVSDPLLPACDNTIGFMAAGQTVTYTCSTVLDSGSSDSKTWLDNFSPAYSYAGNDGDTNFLGSWVESDPQGGGASSGRVLVGSNYKLWMNNQGYSGGSSFKPSVKRAVDLTDMDTATLSFDWITHAGVDSNDAVALEVSTNGGSSFTQIDKFWGANTGGKQESYDVSAYISNNTVFRFRVTDYYGGSDETFKLDNFKIVASGSTTVEGFINVASVSGNAGGETVTDSDPSEVVVSDICVPEPSDSNDGVKDYSIWINGEYFSADSSNSYTVDAANGTANYSGSVTSSSTGITHAVNINFGGFTTSAPVGSPKLPGFNVDASDWVYYTSISGSVGPYTLQRRGPAFQVGYGANMNDNGYGASGWMTFTNGSTTLNGDINISLTDCEQPPVVCEDCVDGQSEITLKVSNWGSNRDQSETIRVREGGLGGAILFQGQVSNNGSFTFNVNNPGTTIVITVQGYYHPSEYVKGMFVTDCDLQLNHTNGNSYITFQVTDLVGDGEDGDCGPVVNPPPPPPASVTTTTISNAYAGNCLDNLGSDTGSSLYKRSCTGTLNQEWQLKQQGSYYEVMNADSSLCLDVYGSSNSLNGEVGQWSCTQNSNQLWEVQSYGGNYLLKSKSSGLCLEVQGSGNAYQYSCDGWVGQRWNLTLP